MWQPIETAPREAIKTVLLFNKHTGIHTGYRLRPDDMWIDPLTNYGIPLAGLSHWRPLPAEPSEEVAAETPVAGMLLAAADAFEDAGDAEGVRRLKLLAKEGPRERGVCQTCAAADTPPNAGALRVEFGWVHLGRLGDFLVRAPRDVVIGEIIICSDGQQMVALETAARNDHVRVRVTSAAPGPIDEWSLTRAAAGLLPIVEPDVPIDENGIALRDISEGEPISMTLDALRAIYSR